MVRLLLFSVLLLQPLHSFASEVPGRVTGRIDCQGLADCRGIAVLWEYDPEAVPDPRRYTLIPGSVSPLQSDGVFDLTAPPGDYYVGAFLRKSPGPLMGPPRPGDLVYLTPNPAGEAQRVRVVAGQVADAGIHSEAWEYKGLTDPAPTRVSGYLVDTQGDPVPGLLVFAFADPEVSTSPLAVSQRSDAQGRFEIPLAKPGTIFMRARKSLRGGRPEPGDYVGVFGGTVPQPLRIAENQHIEGMKILVRRIPDLMQMRNAPATARPRLNE